MSERLSKNSAITLIEPAPNSGGRLENPLMPDTYTGINLPTRAAELLKNILSGKGWANVTVINPRYNEHPGKFDESDWETIGYSPAIGLSFITRTAPEAKEIAKKYKDMRPTGIVIAGGPDATFAVEEVLEWADYVVRYEGDETLPELLEAIQDNGTGKGVRGVSYKDGDRIVNEPDRSFLTEKQLEELPWPQFDPRFRNGRVHASTVITARGCPHRCPFCSVTLMNGLCQRRIGNETALPRIRELYAELSDRIFLADDNFAGKPKLAVALLEQIIEEGLTAPRYMMQLHASIGLRKGFPDLLRKAGVFLVALGIESINDESLSGLGKDSLTAKVNIEGVRAFREAGIPVLGMFINGLDGDNKEKLREQLEWAKKNVNVAQFSVPVPLKKTPFAEKMEQEGRILSRNYYLYDGANVVIRPSDMSPYDLNMSNFQMYEEFLTHALSRDRIRLTDSKLDTITQLFVRNLLKNVRNIYNDPQTQQHLQDLKAWN